MATPNAGGNGQPGQGDPAADDDEDDDPDPIETLRPSARDRSGRPRPDIREHARRVIQGNDNSPDDAVVGILQSNFDLREDRRNDRRELRRLSKLVPGPDAVVLRGEDKEAWEKFKSLNLKVDDVTGLQAKVKAHEDEAASRSFDEVIAKAAGLVDDEGYHPKVLRRFIRTDNLDLEIRKVKRGEETIEVPYVRPKGDDKGEWVALEQYANDNWDEVLPALRAPVEQQDRGRDDSRRAQRAPGPDDRDEDVADRKAVRYPRTTGIPRSRAPSVSTAVTDTLKRRYPSPSERNGTQR